jgi:hypothetical protein
MKSIDVTIKVTEDAEHIWLWFGHLGVPVGDMHAGSFTKRLIRKWARGKLHGSQPEHRLPDVATDDFVGRACEL